MGKLDAGMWRSYYERRETRLFRELISLLRGQFGMTPLEATKSAYHAAHAAFVFKDGKNRTDYEKALPDIEEYYEEIADRSRESFDPDKVAKLELEWWILHRERSPELGDCARCTAINYLRDAFGEIGGACPQGMLLLTH